MATSAIHPLSAQTSLAVGGGKGLNLTRPYRAGFPVPPGFIIGTTAYLSFVAKHGLSAAILDTVAHIDPGDPDALEAAAQTIRAQFAAAETPADLAAEIRSAYADLGCPPVAVRSSATAEDLPGHSFAGQQDTYLNIIGEDSLLKAVADCWSSLWTARAIGYRARIGIDPRDVALAVVVQTMVPSETSGVLFTANPLTGNRTEMVIDATFGLGEALVSGQVEPDHYVVTAGRRTLSKSLGSKAAVVHGQADGGTVTLEQDAASQQAVPDALIRQLGRLGQRIAELFGTPQDIEWATMNEQLYVLQSRPITTLYPVPDNLRAESLKMYRHYLAMTLALDDMVGEVLDYLDRTGKADDTLVVFTSDHGSQAGAQGVAPWNKKQPYEASIRVPWVMRLPGVLEGDIRRDALTAPVDLFPSLCSLLDIPIPRTVEGHDLSGAWRGEPDAVEQDGLLTMNFSSRYDWIGNGAEWRGVRTKAHSYARWLDGREVLFDLESDPLELHSLADNPVHRSLKADLIAQMQALQTQRGDALVPCESYRDWFDTQRRVVRNAFGPLSHPESEPDWSLLA